MSLTGGSKFILTGGATNYQIARSLRFRASNSAYLSRTPGGAGNRKTWTLSVWLKGDAINGGCILGAGTTATTDSNFLAIEYGTGEIRLTTAATLLRASTQQFRDPSAWWNLVVKCDTTQATAADRLRLYANNVEITAWSTNVNLAQNTDTAVNWTEAHNIGRRATGTGPLDGYIAEINFIDGQQLTPSSFGQTDATTGAWNPIKYTGTYGTNGFYLPFSDNSAATSTTIGKDSSGNGNNWTPSGISITAGVTNDSLVDTPTNYGTDTGAGGEVRGNYATFDPLWPSPRGALSNGNLALVCAGAAANFETARATQVMTVPTYWETVVPADRTYTYHGILNVALAPLRNGNASLGVLTTAYPKSAAYCALNGRAYYNSDTQLATYTAATAGQIIGHAYDPATGKYWVRVNGTWQNSGDPAAGTGQVATADSTLSYVPAISDATSQTVDGTNFGQRPFANAAPSGFKALCTQNLPDPAIAKPSQYFDIDTYAGTGATRSKTGLAFQPDFAWFKGRSGATDHAIYDSVRGVQKQLESNTTTAETTETTGLTAFNSDGYTTGALAQLNTSAATYVAWLMKQGAVPGLKITGWTGTGSNLTVPHGAGVTPDFWIGRCRSAAHDGIVWHKNLGTPSTAYLILNSTAAQGNSSTVINGAPDATNIYLGVNNNLNDSGNDHIGYFFNEIAGFSKFGSYTGNGSTDGPFVWCGFLPRFIMFKRTDTTGNWYVYDSIRDTINPVKGELYPNLTNTEDTASVFADFTAGGCKLRSTNQNASGGTYIFAAFAESQFKTARAR